ncbi:flagellar motor stator protein MotA [Seleniivibrio woodruffii]|uniref:Chemotaxis protein MotA n=1 Tax=Seleniivibrio woodruffii TaxID=1078050 RepID=A0A4R1KD81_9BACT|nr:flagellar motor stator protein MotA [Seleniivibrio woodruffii]TCK62546.1 chemotaxis protein MotA [Seleniivibrio woodruffii]TVZ37027.1 chemotaxis protein MotA [Seleniivibrio woodruffii]
MELSTIIGMVVAIVALGVGFVMKGVALHALVVPAAYLIIFGGTAAAILNAFPLRDLKAFPKLMGKIFKGQKLMGEEEVIELFCHYASIARRDGLLALEPHAADMKDPFIKKGLMMIIDGREPDFVETVLDQDIHLMEERHHGFAFIFSQAGGYAPTLGVLGAVVGLIAALGNLSDIEKLGHSIAAAFIATLLGIFVGYVLCHPFCNKLKRMSHHEAEIKKIVFAGIMSLQAGDSVSTMEDKLSVFLQAHERKIKED